MFTIMTPPKGQDVHNQISENQQSGAPRNLKGKGDH
jgi:hypothetical protein